MTIRGVPADLTGRTVRAQRSTFVGAMGGRTANAYPVTVRLPPGPVTVDTVAPDPIPPVSIASGSGWSTRDPAAPYAAGPSGSRPLLDDYAANATPDMGGDDWVNTQSAYAVDITAALAGRAWTSGVVHLAVHSLNSVASDDWAGYDDGGYTTYMFSQYHRMYFLPSTLATYVGVLTRFITSFPWLGSSIDTAGRLAAEQPYLSYAGQGFSGGVNATYNVPFTPADVVDGILLIGMAASPQVAGTQLGMPSDYSGGAGSVTGFSATLRAQCGVTVTVQPSA